MRATHGWVRRELRVTLPKGARAAKVLLRYALPQGKACFDGVQLFMIRP